MENTSPLDQLSVRPPVTKKRDMPGAGDMLTLGILSIVLMFVIALVGIILAIVTLVKTSNALSDYRSFPDMWTEASVSKVRAAQVCAIVALSLFGVLIVFLMAMLA